MYAATWGKIAAPAQAVEAIVKTIISAAIPSGYSIALMKSAELGDEKALKAFTIGGVLSQSCVSLKSGDSVFTEGRGKGSGTIRIRPKGAFKTFFTSELAFQYR